MRLKYLIIPVVILSIVTAYGFTFKIKKSRASESGINAFSLFSVTGYSNNDNFTPDSPDWHYPEEETEQAASLSLFNVYADTTEGDTLGVSDSISVADSISADSLKLDSLAIDSTARLKQFRYQRKDAPYVRFRTKRPSPFFAQPSQTYYTRKVELDSTGNYVVVKEVVAGETVKTILEIPVDDFVKMKMEQLNRDMWEEQAYEYELKSSTTDLGDLLTDITNIQIPLPSSSLFSIFGPPEINLRINGAVDIHGAWRSETTEGISSSTLGNTRNEPDFKQQVQINVAGTIGDKLTINADWNTERTFEYENQLKIHYTGYEDEIIQSVEAGNVSLQTSSLVGGSEALFGIKANFQMGPFTLTALASQKKGEVEEVSVSGGSKSQTFEIRAHEYSENHFFLDEMYADNENFYNNFGVFPAQPDPTLEIVQLEVWRTSEGLGQRSKERKANAYINLDPVLFGETYNDSLRQDKPQQPGISVIDGKFIKMDEEDYNYDPYAGFITFNTQIQSDEAIAVAFSVQGNSPAAEDNLQFGEFLQGDTTNIQNAETRMILKLIKPENLQPAFTEAWKLQLKNIYPIGGRDVKKDGFKLDMKYKVEGQEPNSVYNGVKLLQAFELDVTDESNTGPPDGEFDFMQGVTIWPNTGEIIFPNLQPFGENLPEALRGDSIAYNAVYTESKTFAKQDRTKDKFIITGEYSASVTSTYSIGFNVVDNSVKVLLNGNELKEGSDYSVDYNIGQVIIRNDAALVPGADLRITYEKNDLFALASKTLIGFRGLYEFSKETQLGFSFLNLNQQTLSDKVRIGEEPLDNTIFGLDFKTSQELPFLTKLLDKVISTRTMSSVSLKGEYAYIDPTPNTKKSTIVTDQDKSIAYIDDFEGSKRTIPLGVSQQAWSDISLPDSLPNIYGLSKLEQMSYKAKTFWYNQIPPKLLSEAIWGKRRQTTRDNQNVSNLQVVFRPADKGMYNWEKKEVFDSLNNADKWGGIMKALPSSASNLVEEKIEFVEFWMKVEKGPSDAVLRMDLGQISEDIIPNDAYRGYDLYPDYVFPTPDGIVVDEPLPVRRFDTEDFNGNDLEEQDEDRGIDGLYDEQEPGYNASTNPDPSGDNFQFSFSSATGDNPDDYVRINGTENNAAYANSGIKLPDSEDMDGNRSTNTANDYYSYELRLDTDVVNNPFCISEGAGETGWFLYRIPLKDYRSTTGDPQFTNVDFIRFYITGVNEEVHLRFVDMNLVGNQWEELYTDGIDQEDSVLTVGTVSFEDNTSYTLPPGLKREQDRTNTEYDILKNEQSLLLQFKGLEDGTKREVVKYLFRPLDLFNYKEMKMFFHGDTDVESNIAIYNSPEDHASDIYFRFGSDSLNYYEYRQPVKPGWQEIAVAFENFTAIKALREYTDTLFSQPVPGKADLGHTYGILGNPSLMKIDYFNVGVVNVQEGDTPDASDKLTGDIWLNELRVLDADDSPGWAYTASSSIQLADFVTANLNMSETSPYFHRLSDRFGSRIERRNWGANFNIDLLKLIPVNLSGSNLRLNYSHSESVSKPLYQPGTDIKVSQAAEETKQLLIDQGYTRQEAEKVAEKQITESQTLQVSDSWSLSNIKIQVPTEKWYIRDFINKLVFNFNYNTNFSRDPTTRISTSWLWNASGNYSLNLSKDYFFYPANIPILGSLIEFFTDYRNVKVYYTPRNVATGLTAKRNYSYRDTRDTGTEPSISRDFTSTRNFSFAWKFTEGGFLNPELNYSANFSSSLAHLLTRDISDSVSVERTESAIWSDIFSHTFFGRDFQFRQSLSFKTNPKLPTLWDIDKYFTINASYNVDYQWQNNFRSGNLGRSASFTNRINAGINLRLKKLMEPLFEDEPQQGKSSGRSRNTGTNTRNRDRGRGRDIDAEMAQQGREREQEKTPDTKAAASDSTGTQNKPEEEEDDGPSAFNKAYTMLKSTVRYIFFDYEQISLNFGQSNSMTGTGLKGAGSGFNNFWGVNQSFREGPSRLFMLGLDYDLGPRAANGSLNNNFSQRNTVDLKTSRPLWEGAQIDLSWNLSWGVNKTTSLQTDDQGNVTVTNAPSTGTLERSFLTLPPVFFLSMFNSGIKRVNELYDPTAGNPTLNLAEAFRDGFETLPLFSNLPLLADVAKYVPRPNWRISWNGLEKFSFFESFAKRVSLTHAYNSGYSEGWEVINGNKQIKTQKINFGFSPLLQMNMTFDNVWGGDLTGSLGFSTKTSYNLGVSTRNITESFSQDINISASYSKSGFSLPLFGISLKNDVEISFSYTSGKNSSVVYEMENFTEEGIPQDGTIRTSMEPRIKYVMSSRVTLSLFYKITTVEPEGAARIPPTTTNEAGLDVHISIQ